MSEKEKFSDYESAWNYFLTKSYKAMILSVEFPKSSGKYKSLAFYKPDCTLKEQKEFESTLNEETKDNTSFFPKPKKEIEEVPEQFYKPELLDLIKKELEKTHLKDDNIKMTSLIVAISGLLKNPKRRMSLALTGDSSVGKDNLIATIFKHLPNETYLFLTGATQPALEDEAVFVPILALSEMNLFREQGANKPLLEVVKQRTEGGTSSLRKDNATGFKTTKYQKTEQGTTFYCTTEAERNNESETRFIFGEVKADEEKIRVVNGNTIREFENLDKILERLNSLKQDSWIKTGLQNLVQEFGDYEIVNPYASILLEKIENIEILDNTNPRSMRDIKRILSLTCAMTFLFAKQRKILEYESVNFLISEPEDLINTLIFSQEFFNQTYSGMDERLNRFLKVIDSFLGEWISRDSIQRELKVSVNTIRSWQKMLEEEGLIEWAKGSDLNFKLGVRDYDGNKIYLKRYQKGIKKMLIRCQISEIKRLLEEKKVSVIDREGVSSYLKQRCQFEREVSDSSKNPKIDTFGLTPLENPLNSSSNPEKEPEIEIIKFPSQNIPMEAKDDSR
jgi:hypothetical protein